MRESTTSVPSAPFAGFEAPHYTQVPDDFFDEVMPDLTRGELLVLLYVIRHTLGWKKDCDAIALSQFENGKEKKSGERIDRGTGLSRETIIESVRGLEARGILFAERPNTRGGRNQSTVYRLKMAGQPPARRSDYPTTSPISRPDHPASGGRMVRPPEVKPSDPQETRPQTTQQTESPGSPSQNCARDADPAPPPPRRDAEPRPVEDLLPTIRHLARRVANGARRAAWHRQLAGDLADYVARHPLTAAQLERLVRMVEAHGPLRTETEFWERLELYRATYVQPNPQPASAIVPAKPSAAAVGRPLEAAGRRP